MEFSRESEGFEGVGIMEHGAIMEPEWRVKVVLL